MQDSEFAYLSFEPKQAQALVAACQALANLGGPQTPGVAQLARTWAQRLERQLHPSQRNVLKRFAQGRLAALMYSQMPCPFSDPLPSRLPELSTLERSTRCLYLASRNQLLLEMVRYRAFAFDSDNDGKQVRLIGNFTSQANVPSRHQDTGPAPRAAAHTGVSLDPHTDAPYQCSVVACQGSSPAPSALIITARWNPADEPTHIIPLRGIIEQLSSVHTLALTSASFELTTRHHGQTQQDVEARAATSLLQFDPDGGFAMRYNASRFSLSKYASKAAAQAFEALQTLVSEALPIPFVLHADTALLVNNSRALHGRNTLQDGRRLLVRLFGYSAFAKPLVINEDPMLVRG